jgi:hypothetical protein
MQVIFNNLRKVFFWKDEFVGNVFTLNKKVIDVYAKKIQEKTSRMALKVLIGEVSLQVIGSKVMCVF